MRIKKSAFCLLAVTALAVPLVACGGKSSVTSQESSVVSSTTSSEVSSSDVSSSVNKVTDDKPFTITNMFDQNNQNTLGLSKLTNAKTVHVFEASDSTNHYVNGIVTTYFKGKFYCQWQASAKDEDAEDTYVAYSTSTDGITWEDPKVLVPTITDGYCSSGGWVSTDSTLVSYINVWKDSTSPRGGEAYYVESTDGSTWSDMKHVLMKDGSNMNGIIEQDPHKLSSGRLINAAHFQPGLFANPIYTDDSTGRSGWVKAAYTNMDVKEGATNSREMEPSEFVNSDGDIIMTFRDQNSTYFRLASISRDNGETWSKAVQTDMPDSRAKQSAGNLPDGTAYMVGEPVNNKLRIPLCITLSKDGKAFDHSYVLRTQDEIPALKYEGKAKRLGYHYPKSTVIGNNLYISYATNKENVDITIIPISDISLNK